MELSEVQTVAAAAYAPNSPNLMLIKPLEMLGDGAFLFTAFKALDAGDSDTARFCLEAGLLFEKQTVYKERIRSLLLDEYLKLGSFKEIIRLTDELVTAGTMTTMQKYTRARALLGVGRYEDARKAWTELQSIGASIIPASEIDEALIECMVKLDKDAGNELVNKKIKAMLEAPRSNALTDALERLMTVSDLTLSADTAMRILLRVFVGKQDYGTAVRLFKSHVRSQIAGTMKMPEREKDPETIALGIDTAFTEPALEELASVFSSLPYAVAADMCRAFQYSDVETGLKLLTTVYETTPDLSVKFLTAYYLGLMYRGKKINDSAVGWFAKAEQAAQNRDTDNQATWYQIDMLLDTEPRRALDTFAAVIKRTNKPDYFADVLERMSRNALIAKSSSTLVELDKLIFVYGGGAYKARMAYIAAQAAQIGIISQKDLDAAFGKTKTLKSYISERLSWVQTQNSELWFKLLAAYRLGMALVPDSWKQADTSDTMKDPGTNETIFTTIEKNPSIQGAQGNLSSGDVQAASYFSRLISWNLKHRVVDEIIAYPSAPPVEVFRALADYLYSKGEYNIAIRVITELTRRSDYAMKDFDRKIYWPLAYANEMSKALEQRSLNRWIQYALIRSESLFKPDAVSKSGAIGLGQFMPATAQDMAQRLKMETYDLTNPADNLFMSAFYFQGLVNQFDGQVLPAVWAYNAGPGRFNQWKKQFGFLPFDLFMEAIPFSETRQYGKNIGRAAVLYAAIHEKSDGKSLLAYYLGEKGQ